jgi:hypothetical protein
MTDRLHIRIDDLERAAAAGLLQAGQVAPLWQHLCQPSDAAMPWPPAVRPTGPRLDFTHTLYYLGGMLAIGAATLFMTEGWQRLGAWGLLGICAAYAAACVLAARALDRRGLAVPAGILATLAVCLVPLATWALQHALGLWPEGGPERYSHYHTHIDWRWLTLELATLLAAALALWALRHPFLVMPLAVTLWYMSMDLARLVMQPAEHESWRFYRDFSMCFGLLMTLLALWVDARSRLGSGRDYAFWLYLLGLPTFWCALTARDATSELARAGYAAFNLGLLALGAVLQRRVFAACGGLGVAIYLGHLSWHLFRDSLMFPLALTMVGLGVIVAGILWQRHEPRLRAALLARLPAPLRRWVPDRG